MPIGNLDALKPSSHEIIHMLARSDGYPICWPMAKVEGFVGSYNDHQINCPECIDIMKEERPHAS